MGVPPLEPAARPADAAAPAATVPVVVVLGGPSAEHDVSVVSGTAIADALAGAGHPVRQVLVDLAGGWWHLPADHRRGDRPPAAYDEPASLGADGPHLAEALLARLADEPVPPVVFLALHGPYGEDGTAQALCEAAGVAYTGSGVAASAVGMDKALFKQVARGLGLPVVPWTTVDAARWRSAPGAVLADLEAFAAAAGDPRLMVKPARLGSSVGMTLAHGAGERAAALDLALRHDDVAVVEPYLAGARDLEVAVLGNAGDEPEAYGPGEIHPGREFYDFVAKYTPGLSRTSPRAAVDAATGARLRELAAATFRGLGCEGFARVDFLLAGDVLVVSEINTIPGFTPISLFPVLAGERGDDFAGVCRRVVALAVARHAARRRTRLAPADLPR